jgi:hypothetical protein
MANKTSYRVGQVAALFAIAGLAPLVLGFFIAFGLSVVDLLTPGPITPTLKTLVGWPADGSSYGVRMFIGMLTSAPVTAYLIVLAVGEITREW